MNRLKAENINMNQPIKGKNLRKLRILVVPLDWGLGHATRCIPIIRQLLRAGCEPILAAEGPQEVILSTEFPGLTILPLSGYRVKYSRSRWTMAWSMIIQSGKILRAIRHERKWLEKVVTENSIDAIISDNRFGLSHTTAPTVFITHQLKIRTPFGGWSERVLQKRNYQFINRFTECWIPDFEGDYNLAGELSHPEKMPRIPVKYIGPLSRLEGYGDNAKNGLLILLSGPEPQRSILEEKLIKEIAHYDGRATIVRGLPGEKRLIPSTNEIRFFNHLPAIELQKEMSSASLVICRSGYSTIMDLVALRKKSVVVPTPGQTEQEYLATHLEKTGVAPFLAQKNFSILKAIELSKEYQYKVSSVIGGEDLEKTILRFIERTGI